ncbi:methyltransferase domain-containing protein [Psychrobacter sp. F1192]|uniref:tRNA 5-carboxymethoxyuridine methyltransferase n=1 Tax=Psychrobacter coccoides TaxID=2818440 RepID=A0ABS3NNL7_9GAMM|nr:methyltransferase domain-containing protein [Psychrobacter coccoides]MBO1530806.1 methyltransferase domain-containing protein [Psychrobacter coccoides]
MSTEHQDTQPHSNHLVAATDDRIDRSFDGIADHFEKKVYGGLKGEIRLAVLRRDIFGYVEQLSQSLGRPLRVLDVGAGLAQIALELAEQGHHVVINDISANMLAKAKASVKQKSTALNISWHVCPYQALAEKLATDNVGKFDLILCHALLEWLAEPKAVMDFFDSQLTDDGVLSLCFYNPASFDYRNLIMGNFNLLDAVSEKSNYHADNKKSLTPSYPVAKEEVASWLQQHHYKVIIESGLRVFHDYVSLKRGGHNDPEAVIRMELRYSQQAPYKWLGRYLHVMAMRQA